MAGLKIGFNEGSLLRRTLLYVATFVISTVTFIGLMSFLITTTVHGLLAKPGAAEAESAADEGDGKPSAKPGTLKPSTARKKGASPLPVLPKDKESKDE